jgi:amino acid adenylation domain-containing protein
MGVIPHNSPKWILPHYLEGVAYSQGEALALIDGERRVTYSQLRSQVFQIAAQLVHQGVHRGDRVVILAPNSIEFVAAFWAIQYVGAVAVPLNPGIKLPKLRWILADCSPACLIADASHSARDPGIEKMDLSSTSVLWQRRPEGPISPSSRSCGTSSTPVAEWDVASLAIDQDLACIIYTSGSTGTPKGVMLSHLNMVAASSSVCSYLGMVSDDRVFCAIPFSFDYGLHQVTMTALVGATLIVEPGFAQPLFSLHRLVQHGATVFPIVPSMVSLIEPLARRFNFGSVRMVTSTAASLHPSAIDRLQEIFPRARIFSMYGLTECHRCTYLDPRELAGRKSSVGKAIPNTELWVVDAKGKRHDRAATGELVIRGNTVMRGYWNNPLETNEKLRPGELPGEVVLYTGDICTLDEDGFVSFVSRNDDVLKVKGQKVPPKEVEQALMQHPDVREAAVVGFAEGGLGDEVVAFVSLREGSRTEPPALRTWCGVRLESYMVPSRIVVLDTLPKSANGKTDKLALKSTVQEAA